MKLDWAMLADAAQVREGLAFVIGGGIDTVSAPQEPVVFNGTILLRLLLHRTEVNRPHVLEVRINDEDGKEILKVEANFVAQDSPDAPVGWDIPAMFAMNLQSLGLNKFGRYAIEILADGNHLRTLNLRTKRS